MKAQLLTLALLVIVCAATARSATILPITTVTGVNATSDVTVNVSLGPSFLLTGKILGVPSNMFVREVDALSATSSVTFLGEASEIAPTYYQVRVPAGSYNLRVIFTVFDTTYTFFTYLDSSSATPFTVSGATTRDITVPTVNLSTITGTISNLPPSFSSGSISFNSTTVPGFLSVTTSSGVNSQGQYRASLPSGTFDAQLEITAGGLNATTDFGSVDITNPLNFTAPSASAATLSGTVSFAGGAPIPGSTSLSITDTTAGPPATTFSASENLPSTGAYSLTLGTGGTYELTLAGNGMEVQLLPPPVPAAYFAPPPIPVPGTLTGDTTFNPTFQAPPGPVTGVTISGRVTMAGTNTPVPFATLWAFSSEISGAPYTTAYGSGRADAAGNYSFLVPAGTNYTLGFSGQLTAPGDFDTDGQTDYSVFRPSTGQWFVIPSSDPGTPIAQSWGLPGDIPVPGEYGGEGQTDFMVWRPTTGQWFMMVGRPINQYWGLSGDIPVPGDYDGDGKTDLAVWRPSTGQWLIIPSGNPGTPIVQSWGLNGDIPVPGDYDGDGKTDFAVWRPLSGLWYIIPSSNPGTPIVQYWGLNGDVPVPGDYDGDGKTDFAVWRPSSGQWYVIPSSNPGTPIVQSWGLNGDIPVPGDYDGDGKTDFAIWRPSTGTWYVIPSSAPGTPTVTQWGLNGDIPIQKPIGQ